MRTSPAVTDRTAAVLTLNTSETAGSEISISFIIGKPEDSAASVVAGLGMVKEV